MVWYTESVPAPGRKSESLFALTNYSRLVVGWLVGWMVGLPCQCICTSLQFHVV
jgi:hypothetical protein